MDTARNLSISFFFAILLLTSFSFAASVWNTSWEYSQVIEAEMLYGRANITETLFNYPALITLNTTNTTLFNITSNCSNVRIIDETNTTELNITYNSGCGSFPTYFFANMPSQSNSTKVVVYVGNLPANSSSNETNTFINATSRWDMTKVNDSLYNNTLSLENDGGGSDAVLNFTDSSCKFGNCLQIAADTYAQNLSAVIGSSTTGTMSCWINRSGTSYANQDGLFSVNDDGVAVGDAVNYIWSSLAPISNGFANYIGAAQSNSAYFSWASTNLDQTYHAMGWNGTTLTVFAAMDGNSSYSFDSNAPGTPVSLAGTKKILIGKTHSTADFGAGGFYDECRLYSDLKSEDWLLATSALVYNDSGVWTLVGLGEIAPIIYNSTNGTQFYNDDDLLGWITLTDITNGFYNVSYRWFVNDTLNETGTINNLQGNTTGISYNIANITADQTTVGQVWILEANASNPSTTINATNSTSITIINSPIEITQFDFTSNGSAYTLGPVEANVTLIDIDAEDTLNLSWDWYKNGVNQTGLANSTIVSNNTPYNINAGQSPYTIGDNWSITIRATDGSTTLPDNSSENTTIQSYFKNVSINYTSPQYDINNYTHYLNSSLVGASDMNAIINFNGVNYTATKVLNGSVYQFSKKLLPPGVSTETNVTTTWFYKATLANSSIYTENSTYNVTVLPSGIFECGGITNLTSLNITIRDEQTNVTINASSLVQISPRENLTQSFSFINMNNFRLCVTPTEASFAGNFVLSIEAENYSTRTYQQTILFTNETQYLTYYLLNSSSGAFYTFTTINSYNVPIGGVSIKATKFNVNTDAYETVGETITNPDGTGLLFLQTQYPHIITASATDYQDTTFGFTPSALLEIQIYMNSLTNTTAPVQFSQVWNDIAFSLTPDNQTFFTEPFNITYSVGSNTSSLEYYGIQITTNTNGTREIVFSQNITNNPTGSSLIYEVVTNGTYYVSFWFKSTDYGQYMPTSRIYVLGVNTGVAKVSESLKTGILSGWAYYFVLLIGAMVVGGFVSKFNVEGTIAISLLILWAGTIMWMDAPIADTGLVVVTAFHATFASTVASVGALSMRQLI